MAKSDDRFSLDHRVAIVTGASKGIGEAIVRGLAEAGARVVISSRKQEAVDEVAQSINASGGEAIGVACHVGKPQQRDALIEKTLKAYGRIDVLVNNAATNPVFGGVRRGHERGGGVLEGNRSERFERGGGDGISHDWLR